METPWKGWGQLLLGLGITGLFFFMMAPFMVATLLGAVMAVICYPLHDRWRRKLPNTLSAISVTLALAVGIFLPIFLLIYFSAIRLLQMVSQFKVVKDGLTYDSILAVPLFGNILSIVGRVMPVDREWVRANSADLIQNIAEKLSLWVTQNLSGMPGLVLAVSVVILSLYFFLIDGEKLLRFLAHLSPLKPERSLELYHAFESSCRAVVIGLFVSAVVQGALMTLFFFVTNLTSPFLFGSLTVGMGMVPLVGAAPIWIGATLYLFSKSSILMAIVMLLGGLIISTCDNVIRTWIMSDKVAMHPFLALVSVFGALNLVGASGIFLGPIIAAVFVSFLKIVSRELVVKAKPEGIKV